MFPILRISNREYLTSNTCHHPSSGVVIWGGPALVRYVQPTEEELFQRYNPELQKRSLEGRLQREQEFDEFVRKLKEYAKSDKPSMS
jgi:hypothetical protein